MTDIPIKAKVECTDGPGGKSTHLIADPDSGKLAHFVVKKKELPNSPDRLVPVEYVVDTTGGVIRLNCTQSELAALPPFTTTYYVQKEIPNNYVEVYQSDLLKPAFPDDTVKVKEEHIPAGELALSRGMTVKSKESEKVGQVDGLVVDPDTNVITHLLMQKGHLWGKKDIALPVATIDSVGADTVYLKLDKAAVKALPTEPVE
jgi:sporulation protein YlmC with PRC-barrel domain